METSGQLHDVACFPPEKQYPQYPLNGGWIDRSAGLNDLGK